MMAAKKVLQDMCFVDVAIQKPILKEAKFDHSVLGVRIEQSIAMFRGDLTELFRTAPGNCAVSGALFDIERSGKCTSVQRIWEEYKVR